MKHHNILTGAIALTSLVSSVKADVEVLITGATAFRSATLSSLKAQFDIGGSYSYAHDKAAGLLPTATRATFRGTFPGVTGTTTVRCSFNGSVEGLRAITIPGTSFSATYLQNGAITVAGENPGVSAPLAQQAAKFAFSDVRQTSTPISGTTDGGVKVGVALFAPVTNPGAPSTFTNVTNQSFKSLFKAGSAPLYIFTGNSADTNNIYASGRNDGSGTRTTYMAESGLGITALVNQFTGTVSGGAITSLRKTTTTGSDISTIWGQNTNGNGGYASGGSLATLMKNPSTGVTVFDSDGTSVLEGPGAPVHLLTFLTIPDCIAIEDAGGEILGWNGVTLSSLNGVGTSLSAADKEKVTYGEYTAWSFEWLYTAGSTTADEDTVITGLKNEIPTQLATTYTEGVPTGDMQVGRPDDGAPVSF